MIFRLSILAVLLVLSGCAPVYASPASDARTGAEASMSYYKARHPYCEACGAVQTLLRRNEVHHIIPCAVAPDSAADLRNMITLCRPCHIVLGHCGDRGCRKFCPNVRETVSAYRKIRIVRDSK